MYVDAHNPFCINIPGNMISLLHYQNLTSLVCASHVQIQRRRAQLLQSDNHSAYFVSLICQRLFRFVFFNLPKVFHQIHDLVTSFLVQLYICLHDTILQQLLADGGVSFQRAEVHWI